MKKKFSNDTGDNSKKKTVIYLTILVAVIAALFFAKTFYYNANKKTGEEKENIQQQTVLIANKDLKAGDFADENCFSEKKIAIDTPIPKDAVTNVQMLKGQRVRSDMKENEILQTTKLISKNIWYEPGDRFVEHQFTVDAIPSVVPNGNIVGTLVDIVLFKQGSNDEIVVSKAVVVSANENKLGFNLNSKEREYLKEASTYPGGFYITAYLDENQEASTVTYSPEFEALN